MLRLIRTNDKPKLQELSIKQRDMLMAYGADNAQKQQQVTWREFIQESKQSFKTAPIDTPTVTPRPSNM